MNEETDGVSGTMGGTMRKRRVQWLQWLRQRVAAAWTAVTFFGLGGTGSVGVSGVSALSAVSAATAWLDALASSASVGVYIAMAATSGGSQAQVPPPPPPPLWLQSTDAAIAIVLLLLWLPPFILSSSLSLSSVASLSSFLFDSSSQKPLIALLTLATTLPVIWVYLFNNRFKTTFLEAGPLVFLIPLRFWRLHLSLGECLKPSNIAFLNISMISLKSIQLASTILTTLLTVAAWVHICLYTVQRYYQLSFFDVFYTIAVSSTSGLSTQIVPDNLLSRIVTLYVMLIGAIYLPTHISDLLTLIRSRSKFDRPFKLPAHHRGVLVVGHLDVANLRDFVREFFCPDHGLKTLTSHIILLNPEEPSEELQLLMSDPVYISRIHYVKGSTMSFHSLQKASAHNACAAFILSSRGLDIDPVEQDARSVMRALSLRKFNENLTIFSHILLPGNKSHLDELADHTLCIDEFVFGMLAQNTLAPGFATMIYLLTTSISDDSVMQIKARSSDKWMHEYLDGATMEIYTLSFSHRFRGLTFGEAALDIYEQHKAILFALRTTGSDQSESAQTDTESNSGASFMQNDRIVLSPMNHMLDGTETGFIIARSSKTARLIAKQGPASRNRQHQPQAQVSIGLPSQVSSGNSMTPLCLTPDQIDQHLAKFAEALSKRQDRSDAASRSHDPQPDITANTSKNCSTDRSGSVRQQATSHRNRSHKGSLVEEEPPTADQVLISRGLSRQSSLTKSVTSLAQTTFASPRDFNPPFAVESSAETHYTVPSTTPAVAEPMECDPFAVPDTLSGHIVISSLADAFPANLSYFVAPLRHKDLDTAIVILCSEAPSTGEWARLATFGNIYYSLGTPMLRRDLRSIHIQRASRAIVLANPKQQSVLDRTADASALLALLNIQTMCADSEPAIYITVEFIHHENMKFVTNSSIQKRNPLVSSNIDDDSASRVIAEQYQLHQETLNPSFISGKLFCQKLFHGILCQTFYNDSLLSVLKALLFNGIQLDIRSDTSPNTSDSTNHDDTLHSYPSQLFNDTLSMHNITATTTATRLAQDSRSMQGHLYQIALPSDGRFTHISYGSFAAYLIQRYRAIPLGLYRGRPGSDPSVVVVNPCENVAMGVNDHVYVLAERIIEWD
eukprot:jgi/Hompol1/5373/HPOL_001199-RA